MGEPDESRSAGTAGNEEGGAGPPARRRRNGRRKPRRRFPRFLRRGITLLLLVFVVIYFVVPTFASARDKLYVLSRLNPWLLLLAIGLEVVAQLSYAELTMSLLPKGALRLSKVFRINLSALAVSHVLPGGTAGGTPVGYRLMTSNGVPGADVGVAAATQGIGSAVVLNALLWIALIISIPLKGFSATYVSVAIFGAVLMGLFATLVFGFTKGEERTSRIFRGIARRVHWVTEDQVEGVIRRIGSRLRALGDDRRLLLMALLWALLNWLLDAAALWACVAAFGTLTNPIYLVVAYGVGNVLAAIPITPGGLGLVETSVPALLKVFGVAYNPALFGVLAWRLVNFWLPIPVGAGAYVSLIAQRGASLHERLGTLGSLTERPQGAHRITTPELALESDTLELNIGKGTLAPSREARQRQAGLTGLEGAAPAANDPRPDTPGGTVGGAPAEGTAPGASARGAPQAPPLQPG